MKRFYDSLLTTSHKLSPHKKREVWSVKLRVLLMVLGAVLGKIHMHGVKMHRGENARGAKCIGEKIQGNKKINEESKNPACP